MVARGTGGRDFIVKLRADMEPKDRITILLAEYNTLRAEVLAARVAVAQAIAIGAPLSVALLSAGYYSVAATVLIIVVLFAIWNDQNTRAFTCRIRSLESSINETAGQRLMLWETDHGWGSIFPPPSNKNFAVPPHWIGQP
jgi:hypothetical protein